MKIFKYLLPVILLLHGACTEPPEPTESLYRAVHSGNLDQLKRHIYWKTDINQFDTDGYTPLQVVSRDGRWTFAETLIQHGADVNKVAPGKQSALVLALLNEKIQVADLLIKKGASFNADDLLMTTVESGVSSRDLYRLLARTGSNFNMLSDSGQTPLTLAINRQDRTTARDLINAGADVNLANGNGETPLMLAQKLQQQEIVTLLLRNGAVHNDAAD